MAIKRYTASQDTTITNAFASSLITRGSGSNMGESDILEVFSIYGQASSSSIEKSRALLQFPVTTISTDRTAGTIPASGSVDFYLRVYNAEHPFTVPRNMTLVVHAVSRSWDEGTGLDMEEYVDDGYCNWIAAQSGSSGVGVAATLVDAIDLAGIAQNDAFTMTVPAGPGGDGVAHQFVFDNGTDVESLSDATGFGINIAGAADDAAVAAVVVKAINGIADNLYQYGGAALGADSTLAAGTLGLTAAITSGETTKITLTMDDPGEAGNVENVLAANVGFEGDLLLEAAFTGGSGIATWTTEGGDFHTGSYVAGSTLPFYSYSMTEGTEDVELDITSLVEEWLAGPDPSNARANYGLAIFLTSSQEDGSESRSFYTKKFFARGSEFFFKRPAIEARWNSSNLDDANNFYLSSSLAPGADNLNTLFLYNYVRGQLKNIPSIGATGSLLLSVYSGSTGPTGDKISLPVGGNVVANNDLNISGGYVETGIYSASFAYTSSAITRLYPVWHSGSTEYYTGSAITLKQFNNNNVDPSPKYVSNITNLKSKYSNDEVTRFRLYVRQKDWSPTIYTKANSAITTEIIDSGFYKIVRIADELEVIPFGTGSTSHTKMSHDASGSYFDLDMELLEVGYAYQVYFAYYINGAYHEQPEVFKFRVE